jgi:exopolysaccharide biosynthesis WecB/TagA/CpsF family protein
MPLPYVLDDYDLDAFVSVARSFGRDRFGYVVTPNVDHLIRYHDDKAFRALYAQADYILLDSRFLSHIFRIIKSRRVKVCTGSDLTAELFRRVVDTHDQIVLIGGSDAQALALAQLYGLENVKHYNPPMNFVRSPEEVEKCVQFVEANSPFRFCFLAVGAPQQEVVAQLLKSRGKARGMALCIGASINFLTGQEKRAPLWMQKMGAEWIYRLLNDPKRLAKRYLVRGPRVFWLLSSVKLVVRPRTIIRKPASFTATGSWKLEDFKSRG